MHPLRIDDTLIPTLAGVNHETDLPCIGGRRHGAGGMTLARHDDKGGTRVTRLSRREIAEKLDGKDTTVTVEELVIEPGGRVAPHRHAGPVFGYVLEGEYEHALGDDPVTTYKAGDTFYEPSGCVHRVTRNPAGSRRPASSRSSSTLATPRKSRSRRRPRRSTDPMPLGEGLRTFSPRGLSWMVRRRRPRPRKESVQRTDRRPAPRGEG